MCNFLSVIVVPKNDGTLKFFFSSKDSHSWILDSIGINDNNCMYKDFARLECEAPYEYVNLDQDFSPLWVDDNWREIEDTVRALAKRVAPYHDQFMKELSAIDDIYYCADDFLFDMSSYNDPVTGRHNKAYFNKKADLRNDQLNKHQKAYERYIHSIEGIPGYVKTDDRLRE